MPAGISVAAALLANRGLFFRLSDDGEARGMFCGMGVCYDCLVEIDGKPDQRACMVHVEDGMNIRTGSVAR